MLRANAVLGKELTTRMRGWRAAAVITAYLALLSVVSLLILGTQITPQNYGDSARLGQLLFGALAVVQLVQIVIISPASTADAISGERQRQTLELLLVTRLSSLGIVLGKLISGLAFNVLLILCSLPLFSLVFLFGGVSFEQVVSVFVVFLATTLVLGSMSLFISTIMRRSGASTIVSLLCTLSLTVGLGVLTLFLFGIAAASNRTSGGLPELPVTGYFDPLTAFVSVLTGLGRTGTSTGAAVAYLDPLGLSLWGVQVLIDVVLSVLFVLASVRLLRPRWSPHHPLRVAPASPRDPGPGPDTTTVTATAATKSVAS